MNLKQKTCLAFLALILVPVSSFAFDRNHERQAHQQAHRHAEWHRQAQGHPCYQPHLRNYYQHDRGFCRQRSDHDILVPIIIGTMIGVMVSEAEKDRRREEARQLCKQVPVLNQDGEIVAYRQVCN